MMGKTTKWPSFRFEPRTSGPLWDHLKGVEAVPKVLALLNGIQLVLLLIARAPIVVAAIIAVASLTSSVVGVWQYRRNQQSLRSILRLFQLAGWPLAVTLGEFMWNVSYLTGTHALYASHMATIGFIFALVFAIYLALYLCFWATFTYSYTVFKEHRAEGGIAARDLYLLLVGRSSRWTKLALFVTISIPVTMLVSRIAGRIAYDVFLLAMVTLVLFPYIAAVLVARIYLQRKYLGSEDLRITD
jgi:hypothetical protein